MHDEKSLCQRIQIIPDDPIQTLRAQTAAGDQQNRLVRIYAIPFACKGSIPRQKRIPHRRTGDYLPALIF